MKNRLLLLLLLALSCMYSHAQNALTARHGKVVDKKTGEAIPGAQVSLKADPKRVVVTDDSGRFSITVPSATAILVIHSLGYKELEVPAADAQQIGLESDISGGLEEVVVVGAVLKKRDLTGAVASINSDKIALTPTSSINQAIQGKLPGARITSNPSPGADAAIKVRGNNSIQFGTNPIFVVDGVIIDKNFNTLNPDDVESVEVLKDASATAIYGARGANGVVIVTTKKGKKGTGTVSYSNWVGWQWFSKKLDLLDVPGLYNLRVDAFANQYMEQNPAADRQAYINQITSPGNNTVFTPFEQDAYKNGQSYDWLGAVTRTGIQQNHTLSFAGGSDKGTYLLSMNYTDQKGLIKNSDYKRYGGRLNIDQNVKSWLRIGTNTTYSYSVNDVPDGSVFSAAVNANPMLPIDTSRVYMQWGGIIDQNAYNPLKSLALVSKNYMGRLITSNYVSITPVKDITFRSTLSADLMTQQNYAYIPSGTGQDLRGPYHGHATHYKAENTNWQWDNTVTYNKRFGKNNINALVGTSAQKNISNYNQVDAYGFPDDDLSYMYLNEAYSKDMFSLSSDFVTTTLASFLGRADYSYNNKYFATVTVRYDGTSKFGPGHKWGAFPSLALGWDMSREKFMSNLSWINRFKWRTSYGIAGNQNIDNYAYLTLYRAFYSSGSAVYRPDNRFGNPDLKWERQKQVNLGVDLSFLNNRLNFTADYFNTLNDNLLMLRSLATTSGFKNTIANVGALKNVGVEFNVNYAIIQKKALQWNFYLNFSADKNKITKLYANVPAIYNKGGFTGVEIQRTGNFILGQSLNSVYSYKFEKIAQESDMPSLAGMNFNGRTVHPGDIVPVDKNGDKSIDDNDKYVVGKLDPKFYGGFGTDLSYKNFGINLAFNYSSGAKRISGYYEGMVSSAGMSIASVDMLNRWTPQHTNTIIPRALYGITRFNPGDVDAYLQNASFLRLSTATLSYTLPAKAASSIKLSNARFYVTGTNLLLLTKDKGFDPETGDGYPNFKSIVVGLNIGL